MFEFFGYVRTLGVLPFSFMNICQRFLITSVHSFMDLGKRRYQFPRQVRKTARAD